MNCPTLNVDPETRVIVGLLFNMESSDEGGVHNLTLKTLKYFDNFIGDGAAKEEGYYQGYCML